MDQPKQPTLQAVEAALSEYRKGISDKDRLKNVWAFMKFVKASPVLHNAFKQAAAVYDNPDQWLENIFAMAQSEGKDLKNISTPNEMRLWSAVAEFFFLGWHARGAVDDADQLRKLME